MPRGGPSTKAEGTERRYFYGSVWAVTTAQKVALVLWKILPQRGELGDAIKLVVYAGVLFLMGMLAWRGSLPRTRPILPGELMVD